MKKILIPTDYSDLSDYALNLANKIAAQTNAELYSLNTISVPGEALFDTDGKLISNEDFDISALEKAQSENEKQSKAWSAKSALPVNNYVQIGHLEDQILEFTELHQIDLVVMGTHGAQGLKELIAGSVAQKIEKEVPIPVLTLKCDRSSMDIHHILYPTTFEDIAEESLYFLKEFQKAFSARLHLLKINTTKDFTTTGELHKQAQDFISKHRLENVDFSIYCDQSVAEGIVNFADEQGIDLITIGRQTRSILSRTIKKSITKKLINHVAHPVLAFGI